MLAHMTLLTVVRTWEMLEAGLVPWFLLAARLGVAATFAIAALAKLADTAATRASLQGFGVPKRLGRPAAVGLPLGELVVAALLVSAATARVGAVAAAGLLLVFSAGLARAVADGNVADCNCFGALRPTRPAGALLRNAALVVAMAAVVVGGPGRVLAAPTAPQVIVDLVIVAIVAMGWLGLQIARQRGTAVGQAKVAADDSGARAHVRLEPGARAPRFALPDAGGSLTTLDDLLVTGRPLVLAFSDPDCAACDSLPEHLSAWRDAGGCELEVALVTRGAPPGDEHAVPVLIQSEHEVARAYGAGHVPSAFLIGSDGSIGSPLALGESAIERLLLPQSKGR
jgi:uncharacterized membrane protein YphA (DoxX/SURF4 family)